MATNKPGFDDSKLDELTRRWAQSPPDGAEEDRQLGFDGGSRRPLPPISAQLPIRGAAVVAHVGTPQENDYRRAGVINEAMPDELDAAARSLDQAIPLVLALLLDGDAAVRAQQETAIRERHDPATLARVQSLSVQTANLHPLLRLPLASLAFPVLRRRPRPELDNFIGTVDALANADGEVSLFEYCLACMLRRQLTDSLDPSANFRAGRRKPYDVRDEIALLLSVIAQHGEDSPDDAQRAYDAGMRKILPNTTIAYAPPADGVGALDRAWPALDCLDSIGKSILIEGLVATIGLDGKVTVAESELLRTVCAVLHCPLPPMLERS